jgi:ACS family hexuronate transporter-like MFS transporter
VLAYLAEQLGWRGAFYCAGALGFVWLLFWSLIFRRPEEAKFIGEAERAKILKERGGDFHEKGATSFASLLKCKSMWGVFFT